MPAFYRRGDGFGMRGDNSFDGMPERLWACRLSPPAGERLRSAARDLGRTTPPDSIASPLHRVVRISDSCRGFWTKPARSTSFLYFSLPRVLSWVIATGAPACTLIGLSGIGQRRRLVFLKL